MKNSEKVLWLAVMLLALAVRLPNLKAGYPYINYIDEGAVIKKVALMLHQGTWDPEEYLYPSLPFYTSAAAALCYSPFHSWIAETGFKTALADSTSKYYDVVAPPQLLIAGRMANLLFALGIVLMTGMLARRIAGTSAGIFAALLAALVPALVLRSTIIAVDTPAAFFTLACLYLARAATSSRRPMAHWAGAGAMAGLAAVSKYTAGLVFLAVAFEILLEKVSWGSKAKTLAVSTGAAVAAALAAMPALWLRTDKVISHLLQQRKFYSSLVQGSYWEQAITRAEWDLPLEYPELGIPFMALLLLGLLSALTRAKQARLLAVWSPFVLTSLFLYGIQNFQPFRNLLPLVPLACIPVALLADRIGERMHSRRLFDAAVALAMMALFIRPLYAYAADRLALVDSRVEAVDWLAAHTTTEDIIVVSEELALLPSELSRLGKRSSELSLQMLAAGYPPPAAHYFAGGKIAYRTRASDEVRQYQPSFPGFETQVHFGSDTTDINPGNWRGNRQGISILRNVRLRPK